MAKTSKCISTISYNTKNFLIDKLESLIYLKIITYYEFIEHLPDEDDRKKHIHLFIMPNQNLDLLDFKNKFDEYTPLFNRTIIVKNNRSIALNNIKHIFKTNIFTTFYLHSRQSYKNKSKFKPLGCMPFRVTHKFGDWYWYVLHNADYLRAKELIRNIAYSDNDIFTHSLEFHNQLVLENRLEDFCTMGDMQLFKFCFSGVQNDVSLSQLLSTGYVPLSKVNQFKTLYNSINKNSDSYTNQKTTTIKSYSNNNADINQDFMDLHRLGYDIVDEDPIFD